MKKTSYHLKLAHGMWENFLEKNFVAIDATCGNGHDAYLLAELSKKLDGKLYCFDLQKSAIDSTKKRLSDLSKLDIDFVLDSHENLSKHVKKANLIVYNLGYLPGGEKSLTTMKESTITSIKDALSILDEKGAISIIAYPGHPEGEKEQIAIEDFLKDLNKDIYTVCHHRWINKEKSPTFFWIEKIQVDKISPTT